MTRLKIEDTPEHIAGVLLREAASALHAASNDGTEWVNLTFQEKTLWGAHAAGPIVTTLLVTKPEGWEEVSQAVITTTGRWVAQSAGAYPTEAKPATTEDFNRLLDAARARQAQDQGRQS